jgi:D-tyrosyl-tRNA(Tyr) deacylase
MLLVGVGKSDTDKQLKAMAQKIANMRIFPDEQGRFHLSVIDIQGGILAVPQFTLYADTKKGRRPEFFGAMPPEQATVMFDQFVELLGDITEKNVEVGVFGADMQVALENSGPVTIMVEIEDEEPLQAGETG